MFRIEGIFVGHSALGMATRHSRGRSSHPNLSQIWDSPPWLQVTSSALQQRKRLVTRRPVASGIVSRMFFGEKSVIFERCYLFHASDCSICQAWQSQLNQTPETLWTVSWHFDWQDMQCLGVGPTHLTPASCYAPTFIGAASYLLWLNPFVPAHHFYLQRHVHGPGHLRLGYTLGLAMLVKSGVVAFFISLVGRVGTSET